MKLGGKIFMAVGLVAFGVAGRLLPHAWNFTPVIAVTLVAGHYLGRKYAVWLPLAVMLTSDLWLGFYETKLQLVVYLSLVLIGLASGLIGKQVRGMRTLEVSSSASLFFFLTTNWAVWQFSAWYPKTAAGLLGCYTAALPFFRNSLLGDVFYTAVMFLAIEAIVWMEVRQPAKELSIKSRV